ncbi:MAG TPA: C39 family peptidase [Nocardioidaceae bacterium]|nr:C39 family peptidase [Nocardioidaceae bacterium]
MRSLLSARPSSRWSSCWSSSWAGPLTRARTTSSTARFAAGLAAGLAGALALSVAGPLAAPASAKPARQISYHQWDSPKRLDHGRLAGLTVRAGRLQIGDPVGTRRYADPHAGGGRVRYEIGRWTSPWRDAGFGFTELIPSWKATVDGKGFVRVQVRGRSEHGQRSSWDTIANWAPDDSTIHRTSLPEQADDLARVAVDTWKSNYSLEFTSYQLRLVLFRRPGSAGPRVDTVGAMVSRLPQVESVRRSRPGPARGVVLDVPRYSQMIHTGDYPEFGNGGEAWCSPTSTSMVLGYYDRLPARRDYRWVMRHHPNRFVDHAARMTYDYRYDGAGNWPFNTAYAAPLAGHAFVTRLRNLRQAERFIAAGVPVVASIAFGRGELDGAPISATNGHLVVIVGFTESGDVVVNDPAARRNRDVRRTYDRGQFENAWLPASGGLAYIIRTDHTRLPARHGARNW